MDFTQKMLRDDALAGKTIVITGGGSGLGKSMTRYFMELGANVAITSRDLEKLQATASELEQATGGKCLAVACDVRHYDQVEAMLGSAKLVAIALIVGGVAILIIEKYAPPGTEKGVADISLGKALGIGLIQGISMVPGVSRSGATILGGLSLGVERRTAAEFSFFLAIPTMLGATTLELWKNHDKLGQAGAGGIALGFVVSFLVALLVIKWFIGIVTRRGFAPFAWYRIVAGSLALIWLTFR